jgi:hypothetical protein
MSAPKQGSRSEMSDTFRCSVVIVFAAALVVTASLALSAQATRAWTPPVTSWGDPDLTGRWPVTHLNGTPVQRPAEFGDRRLLTDQEFAKRQADIAANRIRLAGAWAEVGEANRLTSLVVDPANGRLPPLTDEGRKRAAAMTSSWSDMLFASVNDFNALDRCMTRGMPASMFPFMYNSGIEILQAPGYVVIRFELIHETRVIPLDGRPRQAAAIRFWLGEPRGRWEGRTLVVETTNFNGRTPMLIVGPGGGGIPTSESLRVIERFTRVDEDTIDYDMTVEDPVVLTRPWKAAFPLKRDPDYYLFEYACHEGNQAISNALRNSRHLESQSSR